MTGRLRGKGRIREGSHRYHRGKGKYSRHSPSLDGKRRAKRRFPSRGYRHTGD